MKNGQKKTTDGAEENELPFEYVFQRCAWLTVRALYKETVKIISQAEESCCREPFHSTLLPFSSLYYLQSFISTSAPVPQHLQHGILICTYVWVSPNAGTFVCVCAWHVTGRQVELIFHMRLGCMARPYDSRERVCVRGKERETHEIYSCVQPCP